MANVTDVCAETEDFSIINFSDANRVAGMVLLVLVFLIVPVSVAWWTTRSGHPYLAKRNFWLMLSFGIGLCMYAVLIGVSNYVGREDFPCDLFLFLSAFWIPFCAGPVIVRLMLFRNKSAYMSVVLEHTLDDFDPDVFEQRSLWSQVKSLGALYKRWLMRLPGKTRRWARRALTCAYCAPSNGPTEADLDIETPADTPGGGAGRKTSDAGSARGSGHGSGHGPGAMMNRKPSRVLGTLTMGARSQSQWSRQGSFMSHVSDTTRRQALFLSQRGLFGFFFWFMMVLYAAGVYLLITLQPGSPYGFNGCTSCVIEGADFFLIFVAAAIMLALIAPSLLVVRNYPDPLGILREIKNLWWCGTVFFIAGLWSEIDPGELRVKGDLDANLVILLFLLIAFVIQGPLPVYRTYRAAGRKRFNSADAEDITLEEVWAEPTTKEAFTIYCAMNLTIENVRFINAVDFLEQQRTETSATETVSLAVKIYNAFVRPGAMLEVNISSAKRQTIKEKLAPWVSRRRASLAPIIPSDVFGPARDEVWQLIQKDAFARFLESKLYHDFVQGRRIEARSLANFEETFPAGSS